MRRLSGMLLAGALLILPASAQTAFAQEAAAPAQSAGPQKTLYTGELAIVVYAVNPGKDADYEQVMAKLRDALGKSTAPEAKQQAAGWKIFKSEKPLTQDGASTYIHIISPVVKGADYSIVNIVYSVSTDDEKRAFYDLYKGALKGTLSLIQGNSVAVPAPAASGGGAQ